MKRNVLFIICSLFTCGLLSVIYAGDKDDSLFFHKIEKQLRDDYYNCTGSQSGQSLQSLIKWNKSLNNFLKRKDYRQIVKKFHEDSTNHSDNASPCEIAVWYEKQLAKESRKDSISKLEKEMKMADDKDSILTEKEVSSVLKSSCDLMNIPFGISMRSALRLLGYKGIKPITGNQGIAYFVNNSDPVFHTTALYFDSQGIYCKYEIESISGSIDSLDTYIRPFAQEQASFFRNKTAMPAKDSNYVSLTDISQGQLSVIRKWSIKNADIFTGLSIYDKRYYAKSVVIWKNVIPEK